MDLHVLRDAVLNHPDQIMPPYDVIYNAGGFDGLAATLDLLGGKSVYVPSLRTVLSKCIESEARKEREKTHMSLESIARKFGYTRRHLSKILNGK